MCGITGAYSASPVQYDEWNASLQKMAGAIAHRGPDDQGIWIAADCGIGFGHRRLSIVDLSPSGHQPMISRSGRFVITYNGEIYNFRDLRKDLIGAGFSFKSASDTEEK